MLGLYMDYALGFIMLLMWGALYISCVHMSRKGSNGRLAMESQVHSFETDLFVGEIMVRLRSHSESAR